MPNNFKPVRVLLFGYIDTNVIDGSAFFLPALANMLTSIPNLEVDLLLARPIRRLTVLKEVLDNPKVNVIDPFNIAYHGQGKIESLSQKYLSLDEAAELLEFQSESGNYDVKIIRSSQVAYKASILNPKFAGNSILYVTGVVNASHTIEPEMMDTFEYLNNSGCSFILQTTEMLDAFRENYFPSESKPISAVALYPMVPDISDDFSAAFGKKESYKNFVYTGKFVREWNPAEILSGISEVHSIDPQVALSVAGDQFRKDDENDSFVEEVRYLLGNTSGVKWHGGVDREQARALISNADVGISWRHPDLDESLELSTKLLEYGTLAKPCIMNRTPMHERLFGSDYPLYANSMTEFTDRLTEIINDPTIVEFAASRSFETSLNFTYPRAAKRILPLLIGVAQKSNPVFSSFDIDDSMTFSIIDHSPKSFLESARKLGATSVAAVLGPFLKLQNGMDQDSNNATSYDSSIDLLDFYVDWRATQRSTSREASRNVTVVDPHVKVVPSTDALETQKSKKIEILSGENREMSKKLEVVSGENREMSEKLEVVSGENREMSKKLEVVSGNNREMSKNMEVLSGEIGRRRHEADRLMSASLESEYHTKTLEMKLADSETRLAALRSSRLGKLQVALWAKRKK